MYEGIKESKYKLMGCVALNKGLGLSVLLIDYTLTVETLQ